MSIHSQFRYKPLAKTWLNETVCAYTAMNICIIFHLWITSVPYTAFRLQWNISSNVCLNVHSRESLTLHHEINTTWQGFLAYEYHTTSYRIGRLLVCYIPHIKHTTPTDSCVWRACQLQRDRQITCVLYTIHQAHHTHYVYSTDFEWVLHIVG